MNENLTESYLSWLNANNYISVKLAEFCIPSDPPKTNEGKSEKFSDILKENDFSNCLNCVVC